MRKNSEHLQYQLEAIKLAQATLRQVQTLGAGGLALLFTFLGKEPFVATSFIGPGVVILWIISISVAAHAHSIYVDVYLGLIRDVELNSKLDSIGDSSGKPAPYLYVKPGIADEIEANEKAKAAAIRYSAWLNVTQFQLSTRTPSQITGRLLTNISLNTLVGGFVMLGYGYILSRYVS